MAAAPHRVRRSSSAVGVDAQGVSGDRSVIEAGSRLDDRYRLDEELGGGGMAKVYRGVRLADGLPVAVKVLSPDVARRRDTVAKFLREAEASARIRHPNVVAVLDYGQTRNGTPFMAMELLEGESLARTVVAEAPMPWPRARNILLQILGALQAAHEQGVVHRDMKPGNCFRLFAASDGEGADEDPDETTLEHSIDPMSEPGSEPISESSSGPASDAFEPPTEEMRRDRIKVLDWGIAKLIGEGQPFTLTGKGSVVGTPDYMAPEMCRGKTVDARSDLYSVAVMAFEMLSGRVPFTGSSAMELMQAHVFGPVPSIRELAPELDVPRPVDLALRKALAKRRHDRFESAAAFAEALVATDDDADEAPGARRGLFGGLRRLLR